MIPQQRRGLLATRVPTSSLPQVLSISPPGRALLSPPLFGEDSLPPLALPSPTEIAGSEMAPDGFGNDRGDVRKSLRALPWRHKPVHLWDNVLRDSRVRPATVAALAALAKVTWNLHRHRSLGSGSLGFHMQTDATFMTLTTAHALHVREAVRTLRALAPRRAVAPVVDEY